MTQEEHPDDRDRVVGWDGATLDDQVVEAMAELERVRVESRPASVFDIFDFGSSPSPNVVLPLREVLGGDGEDEPDPDPYGLWALLDGLRAQERHHLVYGILHDAEVVVADATLVYAIAAARERIYADDADWEHAVPWLHAEMATLLPEDLVERYGEWGSTALSGDMLHFAPEHAQSLVRALRRRGYSCRRDDKAVASACGY